VIVRQSPPPTSSLEDGFSAELRSRSLSEEGMQMACNDGQNFAAGPNKAGGSQKNRVEVVTLIATLNPSPGSG